MKTGTLLTAITLILTAAPAFADPVDSPVGVDVQAHRQVLESMSAEALVDSKLLPKLRVQISREAKKWHCGSQEKLASLPNCKPRNKPAKCPSLADDAPLLAQAKIVRPCEKPVKKMKKRGGKEITRPLSVPAL
jgi:hypothetical protein